jgi:AraC-like DNA-binding protein
MPSIMAMPRPPSSAGCAADVAGCDRPSGASPIAEVRLVARFARTQAGFAFRASSLPGHLLHLVLAGEVEQTCNGRRYLLKPGDLLWYHDDEVVDGRVRRAPWIFASLLLHAPMLPPPPDDRRLLRATPAGVRRAFAALQAAWPQPAGRARTCALHAGANALLAALPASAGLPEPERDPRGRLWWLAEERARAAGPDAWSVAGLARVLAVTPRTLERACVLATGVSPRRRLGDLRLQAARALVLRSDLSFGAIAAQGGWGRVQEFSRAYRQRYGRPPSQDRQSGDDWWPAG